jgi:hypothetical protein
MKLRFFRPEDQLAVLLFGSERNRIEITEIHELSLVPVKSLFLALFDPEKPRCQDTEAKIAVKDRIDHPLLLEA